ncbi:TPA: pheA operon leader peptide PheL [Escherichia coli]
MKHTPFFFAFFFIVP